MNQRLARRDRDRAKRAEALDEARRRMIKTCTLCGRERPVRVYVFSHTAAGRRRSPGVYVCGTCVEEAATD